MTGNITLSATIGNVYNGSSGAVTVQAPNTVVTSYTLLLPTMQGAANQYLAQSGTLGTLTWAGPAVTSVIGTDPIVSSGGFIPAISITQATTSTNGYLLSTDWNAFNNKVTSVSATTPITSTGGTTPTIAIPQATTGTSGYLSSTDWNIFNNKVSSRYRLYTYLSSNQTITGPSTPQNIIFNSVTFDDNSNYNSLTGVYTVPATGCYLVTFNTVVSTNIATFSFGVSGTPMTGYVSAQSLTSGSITLTGIIKLTSGQAFSILGVAATIVSAVAGANLTSLSIQFLAP